jgi:hypothetical protein
VIALTLRTWVRYLVPLTLLALVAFAPLLYLALTAKSQTAVPDARMQVRLGWALAGSALAFHLLLVAGVAPAVRAVRSGSPISQVGALVAGLRGLARGALPWLVAVAAIVLGGVALVVPGALLAILLSLTGASDVLRASPQAALADSIAVARTQLRVVALIVIAIVAVDLALTFVMQLQYVPTITKKATAAKLAPIRMMVRHSALAIVALAPLFACALAAAYSHAKRR